MPEKKKSTTPKHSSIKSVETRMAKLQASKPIKTSERQRAAVPHAAIAAVAQPASAQEQLAAFDSAVKLFHSRKFSQAREQFQKAAEGPERAVADRAVLHIAMCDRRLQQGTVTLRSAEDHYNYGVALINTRNLAEARTHLEKALEIAPDSDHIHYALALAQALGGDFAGAHNNLKRAIELEPRNRLIARQDADFAPLVNQPPLDSLLYPEKKGW